VTRTSEPSRACVLEIPAFGPPVPAVIYNAVRKAIIDGVYRPGESIRQETLARQFSVSRVPIREALSRLEADGLIVLRPRRGYVIKELDAGEIAEIFEMRAVIEEHAAYAATKARSAQDVKDVEALLRRVEETSKGTVSDAQQWVDVNREFHNRIFSSSGRRHLCQAIQNYRAWVDGYIRIEIGITGKLAEAHRDHRQIVNAFKKGDADLAARLSREHCLKTCERLLRGLKAKAEA
jgi:DNA-binding GntR family transcriptional regulator